MTDLKYKSDFDEMKNRIEAWWEGEILDRVPLKVTAPNEDIPGAEGWIFSTAFPLACGDGRIFSDEQESDVGDLEDYFTNPQKVIPRVEKLIEKTYWGGEAFPVMFPVPVNIVAILAAYLGCPVQYVDKNAVWLKPMEGQWENRKRFDFDTNHPLWQKTKKLLETASQKAVGKYIPAIPDLNGPGEILSLLREHTKTCFDIIENPQSIKQAMREINDAWFECWQACHDIIQPSTGSYTNVFTIWSEKPLTDLQCDFSCLISPEDFNELFLPFIEEQTERIDRSIYHLDGPDAIKHVDSLLALPKLDGIQWIPGAGSPKMTDWMPLLHKIQNAGKKLVLLCEKTEVEQLVKELKPEGVLLETTCGSADEAEQLLSNVKKWMSK